MEFLIQHQLDDNAAIQSFWFFDTLTSRHAMATKLGELQLLREGEYDDSVEKMEECKSLISYKSLEQLQFSKWATDQPKLLLFCQAFVICKSEDSSH